jgi:hypothetical protein
VLEGDGFYVLPAKKKKFQLQLMVFWVKENRAIKLPFEVKYE